MPNDVVSRLTDTSKYTVRPFALLFLTFCVKGSHAERFNEDGTGKGKAGREDMKKFDGNTGSTSRSADNLIAPSPEKVFAHDICYLYQFERTELPPRRLRQKQKYGEGKEHLFLHLWKQV